MGLFNNLKSGSNKKGALKDVDPKDVTDVIKTLYKIYKDWKKKK